MFSIAILSSSDIFIFLQLNHMHHAPCNEKGQIFQMLLVAPKHAFLSFEITCQEHGESLAKDGVKQRLGASARHDEKVTDEEVFPAAVVHQGKVQTSEQCFKGVLQTSCYYVSVHMLR